MELQIIRSYHKDGTNGELRIDGKLFCHTIELPWKNNRYQVSCIPEGSYKVHKRFTERFGWHLWVENVPGRHAILVHAFNDAMEECQGCIAPVTTITGHGKGDLSRSALRKLLNVVVPVLDQSKPVFLIFKSSGNELNH